MADDPGMTRTEHRSLTTDGRDADLLAQQARARAFTWQPVPETLESPWIVATPRADYFDLLNHDEER